MTWGVGLFVIFVSLLANAFFAGCETGFTASRRIPILHRARQGHRLSRVAGWLLRRREAAIVTAIVGNNATVVVATSVATFIAVNRYGADGETMAAIWMTVLLIVFGEVLPKAAYRSRPETMVVWSSPMFWILFIALWPLQWAAGQIARITLSVFGVSGEPQQALSRERVLSTLQLGRRQRMLDADQEQLVQRFASSVHSRVDQHMTPLPSVARLRREDTVADAVRAVRETGHSRLPLEGADKSVRGLVLFRDLIDAPQDDPLEFYERNLAMVPVDMSLEEAIAVLAQERVTMAAVVNANDRAVGILTLEDLVEPLVGKIVDEHDLR